MCDEYWERELAKRWKLLATEDELKWLPVVEGERMEDGIEPVVLPSPPPAAEKKRPAHLLLR